MDTNKTKTAIKLRLKSLSLFNKSEKEKSLRHPLSSPSPQDCRVSSPYNCHQCWRRTPDYPLTTGAWFTSILHTSPCDSQMGGGTSLQLVMRKIKMMIAPISMLLLGWVDHKSSISLSCSACLDGNREREPTFVFDLLPIFAIVVFLSPLYLASPSCSSTRPHHSWQG